MFALVVVNGINTASFNVGDMLYLSTNGTLTNVRPTGLSCRSWYCNSQTFN